MFAIGGSLHYYTHHFKHSKPQRPEPTQRIIATQYATSKQEPKEMAVEGKSYDMCGLLEAYDFMKFGRALTEAEAANQNSPKGAYFKHAASMIPHFEKRHKGGEDAYVNRDDLLVVADGVGGWGEVGVDPGLFSKALVKYIEE